VTVAGPSDIGRAPAESRTEPLVSPFRSERVDSTTLVAAPALFDALAARVREFTTLYDWAADAPQARALQGRGVVYVAELAECAETVVVRHAWHGGLLAPITGDRYLMPTRAPREAAVNVLLRARGVPTPELLGYALYPAGPGLRRVDVVSRYVPDAWDFGAVLSGSAPRVHARDVTPAVLRLLRQLVSAGAVHSDLNVKNILLTRLRGGEFSAMVLDVDVVNFRDIPREGVMALNMRRLLRSIRKWHVRHELPLDEKWLAELVHASVQAAS
jgi:3-deoxy-D-manno-octulosonic acid kinase